MLATDITTDGIAVLRLDNEQRRNALSNAMRDAIAGRRIDAAEAPQAALEATKRYLTSSAGVTFREAFEVEHDRVFDEFLLGAFGPGPGPGPGARN
jgi:enoyl-CoA hydratase/carnithine racemase